MDCPTLKKILPMKKEKWNISYSVIYNIDMSIVEEWKNKLGYIPTMDYYIAGKTNEPDLT